LKVKLKKTIVVELRPDEKTERLLREWAENCAVLWNMINYKRRQQFFRGGEGGSRRGSPSIRSFQALGGLGHGPADYEEEL